MTAGPTIAALTSALAAWVPLDPPVRWEDAAQPVPYCITANASRTAMSDPEVVAAIEAAAAVWAGPEAGGANGCASARLVRRFTGCRARTDNGDGVTNVFFRSDWPHGSATLGITRYRATNAGCGQVIDDTGQPWDLRCHGGADVELNDDRAWWGVGGAVGSDLVTVAAHELGHVLGLGHCNDNQTCELRGALMHAAYTGGALRSATDDDVEGLCALYPRTELRVGDGCDTDAQCASGVCAAGRGSARFCSLACPASCPTGLACAADPGAGRDACRPTGAAAPVCSPCAPDAVRACAEGAACVVDAAADPICLDLCRDASDCADGFICSRATDGAGDDVRACVPPSGDCSAPTAGVALAAPLEACVATPCAESGSCESYCANPCAGPTDCGPEERCAGRIDEMVCLPEVREGEPCDDRHICAVGVCVTGEGGAPICHRVCAGGDACRPAQTCEPRFARPGAAIDVCVPAAAPNPPRPDAGPPGAPDAGSVARPDAADAGAPAADVGSACPCASGDRCNPNCECDVRCADVPLEGGCSCRTTAPISPRWAALLGAAVVGRWLRRRSGRRAEQESRRAGSSEHRRR